MKKVLGLWLLLGSLSFACPSKEMHNGVKTLIKEGYISIKGKKMIVHTRQVARLATITFRGNEKEMENYMKHIGLVFVIYAQSHGLEIVAANK